MRHARFLLLPAVLFLWVAPARAEFLLVAGKETPLLLNRTPPIFATDLPGPKTNLRAWARAEVDGKNLRVTLSWDDPTEDAIAGDKRVAYGGDVIYKKPTERTDSFGDAAAMMLPAAKGGRNPGIMMGDPAREVRIVLWRAGMKGETLHGRGRGTVERAPGDSGLSVAHARTGVRRTVTFMVRDFDPELPVSFAVWEGSAGDRNGYKWYTPWYRILP